MNSVLAAVRAQPETVHEIWIGALQNRRRVKILIEQVKQAGIFCRQKTSDEIRRITGNAAHQNIAALCEVPDYLNEKQLIDLVTTVATPKLLVLDCINDPRNLGACLRTAEACGVNAVVINADKSVDLTPVAIKAASGSAARVPVAKVTNLVRVLQRLQSAGVWLVGADSTATIRYDAIDYRRPIAVIFGSERKGLRRLTAKHCDYLATIPMRGEVESLNVSVAAAVLLYEMRRQIQEFEA